jgi:hypothetical protein
MHGAAIAGDFGIGEAASKKGDSRRPGQSGKVAKVGAAPLPK